MWENVHLIEYSHWDTWLTFSTIMISPTCISELGIVSVPPPLNRWYFLELTSLSRRYRRMSSMASLIIVTAITKICIIQTVPWSQNRQRSPLPDWLSHKRRMASHQFHNSGITWPKDHVKGVHHNSNTNVMNASPSRTLHTVASSYGVSLSRMTNSTTPKEFFLWTYTDYRPLLI